MKSFAKQAFLLLVYGFLYLPILILILYSVNKARFSLQWQGFSTQWYVELFKDRELWIAFFHSIVLGISASILATVFGLLACLQLFLNPNKRPRPLFLMLIILIIIPDLVLGVALLVFFNLTMIPFGFFSLLIAHITFCIPFVVLTINARIHTLDANIFNSALDLGANRFYAIRKVLLPLLWPAILSAFLLCFTLSFDDVIISYFVAGPDYNILPLMIYSLVKTGLAPELNALCSITILFSMGLVILAHQQARKSI